MAEQELAVLYGRIEHLKTVVPGDEKEGQGEMLRLWGMVQWILQLEGPKILKKMKDKKLASKLRDGLKQQRAAIEAKPKVAVTDKQRDSPPPEFKYYLDLPDLCVRGRILSFLAPADLLNVASVLPSEVALFKQPLAYLQMHEVFPILIPDMIDMVDVMTLSSADPFFRSFITKYFEDNILSNHSSLCYYTREYGIPLEHLAKDESQAPLIFPVKVQLGENVETIMARLRTCGSRIQHCDLEVSEDVPPEQLSPCLKLMPNIKTLNLDGWMDGWTDVEWTTEHLPELPFLKNLFLLDAGLSESSLQRCMITKFGSKLDGLTLCTAGGPLVGFQNLPEGTALSALLEDMVPVTEEPIGTDNILTGMQVFAQCPLKTIDLWVDDVMLPPLLTLLANHWSNTLESLKIWVHEFDAQEHEDYDEEHAQDTTWMVNLSFPKVTLLSLTGFPLGVNWAFLLLFPALNKLEVDADDVEGGVPDNQPVVQLCGDRQKMLRSNIWNLFPKLETIQLFGKSIQDVCIDGRPTREQ